MSILSLTDKIGKGNDMKENNIFEDELEVKEELEINDEPNEEALENIESDWMPEEDEESDPDAHTEEEVQEILNEVLEIVNDEAEEESEEEMLDEIGEGLLQEDELDEMLEELEELEALEELDGVADADVSAECAEEIAPDVEETEEEIEELISAEERSISPIFAVELIDERRYAELKSTLELIPPIDIAELIGNVEAKYRVLLLRILPKEQAADVFVELDTDTQVSLIESFSDRELAAILEEMYLDDTVDIIEEMPAAVVKRIIKSSTSENRGMINRLLRFDKDTAGAIMTTEYVRLVPDMTVGEALEHIKQVAIDKETIYTCYVTDRKRHLLGIVTAKALLLSDSDVALEDIMEENVVFIGVSDDREEAARLFDRYGFLALPVVDGEQRLVGIVTVDDAMEVIREETEEDFAKMAGMTPTETTYLKTSAMDFVKARLPWLILLMLSATISGAILTLFEDALSAALVLFVPMIMGTGGNSGGQSSVTVIRSLSLGEITFKDIFKVAWKETAVGLIAGALVGVATFLKVMFIDRLILGNPEITLVVALAVAISLFATIVLAKLIGALLPILAKRLGFDPAVMASPFITTLVDAASLLIYFFVAGSVFGITG